MRPNENSGASERELALAFERRRRFLDVEAVEVATQSVHHPATEARVKEVERIKQSMAGADRFEIQQALMPYDLPEKYKGKNERVGVGYE